MVSSLDNASNDKFSVLQASKQAISYFSIADEILASPGCRTLTRRHTGRRVTRRRLALDRKWTGGNHVTSGCSRKRVAAFG